MSRRQAANVERWALQDAAGNPECLLCGQPTLVFSDPEDAEGLASFDLCGDCNRAFRELAQALGDAEEARTRRGELVDQVEGQMALDEDVELGALELGAVLHAFTTGVWDDVPTRVLTEALQGYADGFRPAELAVLRGVLRDRA